MFRSYFLVPLVALAACNSSEPGASPVQIVSSTPASELALIATNIRPFWQVSINKNRILVSGAAAPKGSGSVEVPLVNPTVNGTVSTWAFDAEGEWITIEASRVACVRRDGFRFPATVDVTVGSRRLRGCAEQGSDF